MSSKFALQKCLDQQKFAEALQICRQMRINDSFVRAKIEDQIALAESAFQKGDYKRSIELFKTTIGVSEISLVLSRFFQPHLHTYVIDYLIEIHLQGYATPAYTKLLFNLFIQCQAKEKLQKFIDQISNAQNQRSKTKKQRSAMDSIKNKIKMATSSKANAPPNAAASNPSSGSGVPTSQPGPGLTSQQPQPTGPSGSGSGNPPLPPGADNVNTLVLRNFDINLAVEMLKKGGMSEEAARLSQITGISMTSISSLIDAKKYSEAATQIFDHYDEPIGYTMLMNFGPFLLNNDINCIKIIEQTATVIWKTSSEQSQTPNSNSNIPGSSDGNQNIGLAPNSTNANSNSNLNSNLRDSDFIKLFWGHPQSCYNFLKSIIDERPTELFADTLVSLLIPRAKATQTSFFGNPSVAKADEALELIMDDRLPINCINLLTICVEGGFLLGTAFLLTRMDRNSDAMSLLIHENATNDLFKWIITLKPNLLPEDLFRLLTYFSSNEVWSQLPATINSVSNNTPYTKVQLLQYIITNIKTDIPCSRIVNVLMKNKQIPVEVLKNGPAEAFIKTQEENTKVKEERKKIEQEINDVDKKVQIMQDGPIEFHPSVCELCGEQITPPFVCFFCGHCVHSRCALRSEGESGKPVCPVCYPNKTDGNSNLFAAASTGAFQNSFLNP